MSGGEDAMAVKSEEPPRKILVVEDSRTQAEYLRHILEDEGYRVTLAGNGREALEQIAIDRPSLVFTDVVMPEMDGYEFCRRIKADPAGASIPVVLVTQLFDPADVIRGLECGADDFIIKPFESGSIRTRIRAIRESFGRNDPDGALAPLDIRVGDMAYSLTAGRLRIFNIFLSTYEVAVSKNTELQEAQDRLGALNDQLNQAVTSLRKSNADLGEENAERRRVEQALDEANKKLNLMASITRHDVINQLASQHEFLESALAARDRDPDHAWGQVAAAATIALQALNSLRFTGEYQEVGIRPPAWHNLRATVQSAAAAIPAATIQFRNEIPRELEIFADPLIGRVFANLIENSVKTGQKITRIRFSHVQEGDAMILLFEDDGAGIPAAKKDLIFGYEYGMSAGLGLYLSREILAITAITIRETGTEGKGTRFEVRCPPGTIRTTAPVTE
jgi:DNA-binding response OmpR family regulator